jgi:hypothetical protein
VIQQKPIHRLGSPTLGIKRIKFIAGGKYPLMFLIRRSNIIPLRILKNAMETQGITGI